MSITLTSAAASPDFRRVELRPVERSPAPQNPPVDPALSSKTTLMNHSQVAEFKASTYTKSVSDTSSSTGDTNASPINSNLDLEEATTSTVEAAAETSDIGADEPITENSVDSTDSQNGELTDSDDLLDDSDPDRQNQGRHLDLLEARSRARFMVMEKLASQLIATRHLVMAHFAALPLPE